MPNNLKFFRSKKAEGHKFDSQNKIRLPMPEGGGGVLDILDLKCKTRDTIEINVITILHSKRDNSK